MPHLANIIKKRKSILFICLLVFGLQLKAAEGYSYRLNLGCGFYNDNGNNTSMASGFVGLDFGWRMNKNLNLYVGLNYWDAEQSINWWSNGSQYFWDGSMANLMISASARFKTPELSLGHNKALALFIEPGINIEPIPVGIVSLDEYPDYSYYSVSHSETKVDWFYPSWQLNAGISYRISNNLFLDCSYMVSNMDLLKVYRNMVVAGQNMNDYIPRKELLRAIRFTLGLDL